MAAASDAADLATPWLLTKTCLKQSTDVRLWDAETQCRMLSGLVMAQAKDHHGVRLPLTFLDRHLFKARSVPDGCCL